jgi:ATP-dependent Lon protease
MATDPRGKDKGPLGNDHDTGSGGGSSPPGAGDTFTLPLLPLRDMLVFPLTTHPLFVGRDKSMQALEAASMGNKEILLAAQTKAKTLDPQPEDIFAVGTVAKILHIIRMPDGTVKALVEGLRRARIKRYTQTDQYFMVEAESLVEPQSTGVENEALVRTVKMAFDNYVRLNKRVPPEMLLAIASIDNEAKLADTLVAHLINLKLADKQRLLETVDPKARLEELYGYIQSEIEIMRVEKRIRARVKRQMEKTQKEYYLNEQMQAIQKELGDRDDGRQELQEIENLIKKKKLSKEAHEKVSKELRKLKMMSGMSAEATVVRNYIDTVLSLPWGEYTDEKRDISFARQVLDEDHYGLEKVKERILEYLSVRALVSDIKGPILCLVGPPGVGKTSLGRSIAAATGRNFVRIALGGVRDEAEIRGHRRTYIGSMPGKVLLGLKKAGSANPLILLDEVDKLAQDFRGDPSSALLEVLDPEQNHTFNDHYLDLDFDLSKCLFIATANNQHGIPRPLQDRMEVINLSGYTEPEKVEIAERYLVPKQLETNGLKAHKVNFQTSAVKELINFYTREAGVRNLEREIASLCRKVARKHLQRLKLEEQGETPQAAEIKAESASEHALPMASHQIDEGEAHHDPARIGAKEASAERKDLRQGLSKLPADFVITETLTPKSVQKYLGQHRFRIGLQNSANEVGICTGLAWTEVGGDLLIIEVAVLPGNGKLTITGKLGEVMQESAQAALSYVRSRGSFLGLEDGFYSKIDLHIHVPEGAIPKDGPSAGICMATAIASALTKRPVNRDVAMTGEVTLRGRVLPIGGLKEKVLAAHRGGITKIIIPKENEKDLDELPKNIMKDLEIVPVEHMDSVLMHAIAWEGGAKGKKNEAKDALLEKLENLVNKSASEGLQQ